MKNIKVVVDNRKNEKEFEFLDEIFTFSLDEILEDHLSSCVEHLIDMKKNQINLNDNGVWITFEKFKDGELV